MDYESVTSPRNDQVKNLVRLREGRHRRRQSKYIIEGRRELQRALEKNAAIEKIYFAQEFFRHEGELRLLQKAFSHGIPLCRFSRPVFDKAARREGPDGLLAVAPMRNTKLEELQLSAHPLIPVVEGAEKPGNLGALIRGADAAGADAVIAAGPVTDIFNPNLIRASQGSFFALPVVAADNESVKRWLEEKHIAAIAATPDAKMTLWETDMTGPAALLFGAEQSGLSEFWLTSASARASIPMSGQADSLNLSVSAALFLFEALRQRRAAPSRARQK